MEEIGYGPKCLVVTIPQRLIAHNLAIELDEHHDSSDEVYDHQQHIEFAKPVLGLPCNAATGFRLQLHLSLRIVSIDSRQRRSHI